MNGLTTGEITLIVTFVLGVIGILISNSRLRKDLRSEYREEGEWRGTVNSFMESTETRLSQFEKELSDLRKSFASLCNQLSAIFRMPLVFGQSPLGLSERGKSVSKEIGAQAWVDKVAVTLEEKVKGMDAYGIQMFCFKYVEDENQYTEEEERIIRASAYKRGDKVSDIRQVLAIELRDRLLKEAGLEAP